MNKAPVESISFIKFLWQEFMPGSDRLANQKASGATASSRQPQASDGRIDFQWSPAAEPKELIKVLAVKMPEDVTDFISSEKEDREDERINDWQKIFTDSRQKINNYPLAKEKNNQIVFYQTIKKLSVAIKEIRANRQDKKWRQQSEINSLLAYSISAAFVTAIFLTIVLPSVAYSIADFSNRLAANIMPADTSNYDQIQQPLPLLKFDKTQLADFIRANSYKFPADYFTGHATIVLSEQDILGLPAGAAELNPPAAVSAPNKWSDSIFGLIRLEKMFSAAANKIFSNLFLK